MFNTLVDYNGCCRRLREAVGPIVAGSEREERRTLGATEGHLPLLGDWIGSWEGPGHVMNGEKSSAEDAIARTDPYRYLVEFLLECKNKGLPEVRCRNLAEAVEHLGLRGGPRLSPLSQYDQETAEFLYALGVAEDKSFRLQEKGSTTKVARENVEFVTQSEMLELFKESIMDEGQLMHKTEPALIRKAVKGEHVVTNVGGRVTSDTIVPDDMHWLVKAPTVHQEEYTIPDDKFHANWSYPGEELPNTTKMNALLREKGFKKYWPKPGKLKWMYKVKQADLEKLPVPKFSSQWGALQPLQKGDYLALPYPALNAAEIYLVPNDVILSTYELYRSGGHVQTGSVGSRSRPRSVSSDMQVLRSVSFDSWRLVGDVMDDTRTIVAAFSDPYDLVYRQQLDVDQLAQWLQSIARQYQDNPYHNWKHAFDVFQFIYATLTEGQASKYFNYPDILALFCASVAHDVGHTGTSNAFHSNTGSEIALTYNDKSPLENMHAHVFFSTLRRPGLNFLRNLTPENYRVLRGKVVDAILATDFVHHFDLTERLSSRVKSAQIDNPFPAEKGTEAAENKGDSQLLLQAFIHMADLGHGGRPFAIHKFLVTALEAEFFDQGDKERALGLPISPMMDRSKDSAATGQHFFLNKLVRPLMESYSYFLHAGTGNELLANLSSNEEHWEVLVKKHGKRTANEILSLEDAEFGKRTRSQEDVAEDTAEERALVLDESSSAPLGRIKRPSGSPIMPQQTTKT